MWPIVMAEELLFDGFIQRPGYAKLSIHTSLLCADGHGGGQSSDRTPEFVPNRPCTRCCGESVVQEQTTIHITIHNSVAYDVLPMTWSAIRTLQCG
jgi:DnaJ-class molecular chaperone